MGWLDSLLGKKATTAPPEPVSVEPDDASPDEEAISAPPPAGDTHFFICSENESLIEAHEEVLKAGLPAYGGTTERYSCAGADLKDRQHHADADNVPFAGQSHMGSITTPVQRMADVLSSLRAGSTAETHVVHAQVHDPGAPWVHTVYERMLHDATSQGILPYYMFETKDDGSARYLLDSLRRVR